MTRRVVVSTKKFEFSTPDWMPCQRTSSPSPYASTRSRIVASSSGV